MITARPNWATVCGFRTQRHAVTHVQVQSSGRVIVQAALRGRHRLGRLGV
jgi:hypothetical protein